MRQLQGAIGNAAMGRLIKGRSKRTLARFGEFEHKSIGDLALPDITWRLRKKGAMFDNPFTDFRLTFGDWIALGDWFENVGDVREMLRPDGKGKDRIGQLYYVLFAKIRPKTQGKRIAPRSSAARRTASGPRRTPRPPTCATRR